MVYGALPPEMRNQQARLFNEPGNGYDILVASDAVGMGLNLNIRRIVFHTLVKQDGPSTWAPMPIPHVRQIAGTPPRCLRACVPRASCAGGQPQGVGGCAAGECRGPALQEA